MASTCDDLEHWLDTQLPQLSAKMPLAAAVRYALTRVSSAIGRIWSTAS